MDKRKENTIETVIEIIEEVTGISHEEIKEDSTFFDDLDLTSLEIMSIVGELERKYSVRITEEELVSVRTVKELAEVIDKR